MTVSNAAASATDFTIGPAVSWLAAIGTIPVRGIRPVVGLMPTSELAADGLRIEPEVSVPIVRVARPTDAPTPGPELDPLGVCETS